MATKTELRRYVGTLASILWNYGASFPVPTLDAYPEGDLGFSISAELPGAAVPRAAVLELTEVWSPEGRGQYRRVEYAYEFIEHPIGRRRAFHRHDPDYFAREFGVVVHEHCEERIGVPTCSHYFGLPIDGYEAIRRFLSAWGRPTPFGCAALRCMSEAA
jgi:hypothetical protein